MIRKLCKPRILTTLVTTRMSVAIEIVHSPKPFAITFRVIDNTQNILVIKEIDGMTVPEVNAILTHIQKGEDDEATRLYNELRTKTTKPFEDFIADLCDAFVEDFYEVRFTLPMSDARKMKSLVKMGKEGEARDVYEKHIETTGGLQFEYFKRFYCN